MLQQPIFYIGFNPIWLYPQLEFDRIPVSYQTLDYTDKISTATGTVLQITGLHDSWTTEDILSLRKSLEKLINPFNGADDFEIMFIVPSEVENDKHKKAESQWNQGSSFVTKHRQ